MAWMILHVLQSSFTPIYQWGNDVPGGCVKKGKAVYKAKKSPIGDVGVWAPSTVEAIGEPEKLPTSSDSQGPTLTGIPRNRDPKLR